MRGFIGGLLKSWFRRRPLRGVPSRGEFADLARELGTGTQDHWRARPAQHAELELSADPMSPDAREEPWSSDGVLWRPGGEAGAASFGAMPSFARRRRRRTPPLRAEVVADEVSVQEGPDKSVQTKTRTAPRQRYAGPVIGSMNAAATLRYFRTREVAARAQGHTLEGGVLGPGSFRATCACGPKLSPGELSAVTTPCGLRHDL
jgi:hypothetical protein